MSAVGNGSPLRWTTTAPSGPDFPADGDGEEDREAFFAELLEVL